MKRIRDGWVLVRGVLSDRPALDWVVVAILLAGHLLLTWRFAGVLTIGGLAKDDRMRVYSTVATVASLLFGFATASIAFFYGSADGERVSLMKRVMSDQLLAAWRAALSAPLVAVGLTVVALVVDTKADGLAAIGWVVEGALLLLAVRAVRLRWLFLSTLRLLALDTADARRPQTTTKPEALAVPRRRRDTGVVD